MNKATVTRTFTQSDETIAAYAISFYQQYCADKQSFMTKLPSQFDSKYETIFQERISALASIPTEQEIELEIEKQAKLIGASLHKIGVTHNDISYYAKMAFNGVEHILTELGVKKLSKLSVNSAQFQYYVNQIAIAFSVYASDLKEFGCTDEQISSFQTACKAFQSAREELESYKTERGNLPAKRVTLLNEIYAMLVAINSAAQSIWPDNKELSSRYDLPCQTSEA